MILSHKLYLVVQNGIGAAVVNAALNAGIGWLLLRGRATIPIWSIESVATDTCGMAFGLAFGTYLIVSKKAIADVKRGTFAPLELRGLWLRFAEGLPRTWFSRSIAFGMVAMVLFGLPSLGVLAWTRLAAFSAADFLTFKTLLAAIEGALVTPATVVLATFVPVTRERERAPAH